MNQRRAPHANVEGLGADASGSDQQISGAFGSKVSSRARCCVSKARLAPAEAQTGAGSDRQLREERARSVVLPLVTRWNTRRGGLDKV